MSNPVADFPWEKTYVAATTDPEVKAGPCVLHAIVFNGMTAVGDVSVYDGIDNTGTLIGVLHLRSAVHVSCQPITFFYDCEMATGIHLQYDGTFAGNFTVMHK